LWFCFALPPEELQITRSLGTTALKPQIYFLRNVPKRSADVIPGNSGRYCSAYKLQSKTEYWLVKVNYFLVFHISILGLKLCLGS